MARTLIVSDRHNSFFTANNIRVGNKIPTEGDYVKGDIVVNIGENTANEAMWICVKSGNPGTWEVVGAGAGGGSGSGSIISINDSVFVNEAVTEVSLLGLGGVVASKDKLIVHFNSTHLMEGVDYEISENGTKIVKLGEGKWNESNEAGALFAFELFKQVESIDGNNIVIDSKLTTITNHVVLNGPMHEVEIGIDGFNKNNDMLMVFKNSTFMVEGVDYTISEGGSMIVSTNGEVWNESNVEDFGITFVVFKEVAIYEGGGITLDMLGSDVHGTINDMKSNIAKNTEAIENFDLSPYQEKTDNNLQTTNKTIIGAINEVFQSGNNVKQNLVDALIAKGIDCSTSDSFETLISNISNMSSGGSLDIISASELPEVGNENQICVITDNPVDNFMMSSDFDDVITDENSIVLYLGNTATGDASEGTLVEIAGGNLTTKYYFVKACQGENRLDSYVYQNGAWKLLTQECIYFVENGVERNKSYFGGVVVNGEGWVFYNDETKGLVAYGNNGNPVKFGTPTNKINFSLYNYIEVKALVSDGVSTVLNLGIGTTDETRGYPFPCNSTYSSLDIRYATSTYIANTFTSTTGQTQVYDISSWTGEGYLVLHCVNGGYGRYFRILDMKFY